jgi:hypothetical protein
MLGVGEGQWLEGTAGWGAAWALFKDEFPFAKPSQRAKWGRRLARSASQRPPVLAISAFHRKTALNKTP